MSKDLTGSDRIWETAGSITSVPGFSAAGVACGLKKNQQPDLALIVSDRPAAAAGVFTKNLVQGHSLQLTKNNIQNGQARAVVINSGNANACVGPQGLADARAMASETAQLLGLDPGQVLTGSTGVIGLPLDMTAVRSGIKAAVADLSPLPAGGHAAQKAIMTTDTRAKECVVKLNLAGQEISLAGMAKGSGMIYPNMATMIGIITTDLDLPASQLQKLLEKAVQPSFNRVLVDGDTSVCDMVLALAGGRAANSPLTPGSPDEQLFLDALTRLCTRLAKLIAADGEGATKLVTVRAEGAQSQEDAFKIVRAVAASPLVKTALYGEDANWGRILTAAGYSGASFDPDGCSIWLGDLLVCQNGTAVQFDEKKAKAILQEKEVTIKISLSEGQAAEQMWTCDLSPDYVYINGSYRS